MQSKARLVECAVPSPLAGHAVNPSLGLDGGIHAANGPAIGEDTAPASWLTANEKQFTATNKCCMARLGC
ncbi:hypothetical protein xavtCFBP7764_04740 [Xanthomonas citri]|nr:hypothetical protein xavtCFBP7764_04740 [Xanthomonas citri]